MLGGGLGGGSFLVRRVVQRVYKAFRLQKVVGVGLRVIDDERGVETVKK